MMMGGMGINPPSKSKNKTSRKKSAFPSEEELFQEAMMEEMMNAGAAGMSEEQMISAMMQEMMGAGKSSKKSKTKA